MGLASVGKNPYHGFMDRSSSSDQKALRFLPPAYRDYLELPRDIQKEFGFALKLVQQGLEPVQAKNLQGFGGRSVLELRGDDQAGTYRTVYTVRFGDVVYVLHAFQKKSKKGIATDKKDIELIQERLRWAEQDFNQRKSEERS